MTEIEGNNRGRKIDATKLLTLVVYPFSSGLHTSKPAESKASSPLLDPDLSIVTPQGAQFPRVVGGQTDLLRGIVRPQPPAPDPPGSRRGEDAFDSAGLEVWSPELNG